MYLYIFNIINSVKYISHRTAGTILLLGLIALCTPTPLPADALAELPAAWQERLRPVPAADLSGTETVTREAVNTTRRRLAERLVDGRADGERLAAGYAQLAALYQLSRIDAPAALCWENARRLQPADYRWSYYAGYLALKRGQTDAALAALQATRTLKPDYAPLDLRLAQLWLETNQLAQAQAALTRALQQPGLRAAALYYQGELDLLRRDYTRAQQHLSEALELDPAASGIHYPLAQAYRHLGKQELARNHLAAFKPGIPAADDPLVAELKAALNTSRGDFGRAMRAVEAQDYPTAIQHFEDGLAIDPDNLAARVSYARALYLDGRHQATAQQLRRVLAKDPQQPLARFLLAVLLQAGGETEQAVAHYRQLLQRDAEHAGAHFYLANLLLQQEQFAAAAQQYAAALAANPDIPPARLLELVARHRAGEADRVVAAELAQRVTTWPDQPELKYALIRLRSLSADADVRDSVRALTLANQLAPQQPTPANISALALAAAADGQYAEAARLQQQVIDSSGWMPAGGLARRQRETLSAYKNSRLPQQPVWPADDPLLAPPPLNPEQPFRHYPAAVPY